MVLISGFLLSSCGKNLSLSNPDIQKLTLKAGSLMQKGDFDGAIGRLESINDLNPNLPENNYNLGIAYYKTDKYEQAVNSLQKALTLDKNLKDAYYTLGVIYEEIALKKNEMIEEIKENEEKKMEMLIQVNRNYKKSKENYVSYLEFIGLTTEREQILEKIEDLSANIDKISEKLPEKVKKTNEEN